MKVLGVTAEELSAPPPKGGSSSSKEKPSSGPGSPSPRRLELLERKRQALIAEVEMTAQALEPDVAENVLSKDNISAAKEAGRALGIRLDKSDDKIASLKRKTAADLNKMVENEVKRQEKLDAALAKEKEVQKRIEEQRKEVKDKMEERSKQRQAMAEKRAETFLKHRREVYGKKQDQMQKLNDSFQKVEQLAQERSQTIEETLRQRTSNEEFLKQRELAAQALKDERYKVISEKEGRALRHLEESRVAGSRKVEEEHAKHEERMQVLSARMAEKQKEREEAFRNKAAKVLSARLESEKAMAAKQEEMAAARQKKVDKKEMLLQSCRKQQWQRKKEIKEKLAAKDNNNKSVYLADELQRRAEQRDVMKELVTQNQQRLERASEFAKDQMLARIMQNSARVEGIKEQRYAVEQNRTQLLKEALVKKSQLEERLFKVPPRGISPQSPTEAT